MGIPLSQTTPAVAVDRSAEGADGPQLTDPTRLQAALRAERSARKDADKARKDAEAALVEAQQRLQGTTAENERRLLRENLAIEHDLSDDEALLIPDGDAKAMDLFASKLGRALRARWLQGHTGPKSEPFDPDAIDAAHQEEDERYLGAGKTSSAKKVADDVMRSAD